MIHEVWAFGQFFLPMLCDCFKCKNILVSPKPEEVFLKTWKWYFVFVVLHQQVIRPGDLTDDCASYPRWSYPGQNYSIYGKHPGSLSGIVVINFAWESINYNDNLHHLTVKLETYNFAHLHLTFGKWVHHKIDFVISIPLNKGTGHYSISNYSK